MAYVVMARRASHYHVVRVGGLGGIGMDGHAVMYFKPNPETHGRGLANVTARCRLSLGVHGQPVGYCIANFLNQVQFFPTSFDTVGRSM